EPPLLRPRVRAAAGPRDGRGAARGVEDLPLAFGFGGRGRLPGVRGPSRAALRAAIVRSYRGRGGEPRAFRRARRVLCRARRPSPGLSRPSREPLRLGLLVGSHTWGRRLRGGGSSVLAPKL
ncbi:MAG: hypothetical protein AVDCRST_MAG05-3093, partial [uncultured Rubrobacteraceae bacterium]